MNFIAVMPTNLYGPNDNFDLERSHVLPAMIRKTYLAKNLQQENWKAVREDLNKRPVEGLDGKASDKEITTMLAKYGITKGQLELWGTGAPMREFLWSEEMADATVFVMDKVNFEDLINGLRLVVEFDENGDCVSFFNHSLNIAEEDFLFHSLAPYMKDDSYIEYENETFIGNIKNIYRYKNFKVKHEVIEISDEKDNLSYF